MLGSPAGSSYRRRSIPPEPGHPDRLSDRARDLHRDRPRAAAPADRAGSDRRGDGHRSAIVARRLHDGRLGRGPGRRPGRRRERDGDLGARPVRTRRGAGVRRRARTPSWRSTRNAGYVVGGIGAAGVLTGIVLLIAAIGNPVKLGRGSLERLQGRLRPRRAGLDPVRRRPRQQPLRLLASCISDSERQTGSWVRGGRQLPSG